jgi:hypothetical protein
MDADSFSTSPQTETDQPADAFPRPRFFNFSYFASAERSDRDLRLDQLRGDAAALFTAGVLRARRFAFGGHIFNHPRARPADGCSVPFNHSFLQTRDLLLLTTRPPLDDDEADRCRVHRSYTVLEGKVFACLRRHVARCSPSQTIVSDVHARAFPDVATMRNVMFRQRGGARILRYRPMNDRMWRRPDGPASTLAYAVSEPHAWPDGPALLAVFGMSDPDTLIWSYLLAKRFPHLIGTTPFVMAELVPPEKVPKRPESTGFADQWRVRLLTEHRSMRVRPGWLP